MMVERSKDGKHVQITVHLHGTWKRSSFSGVTHYTAHSLYLAFQRTFKDLQLISRDVPFISSSTGYEF